MTKNPVARGPHDLAALAGNQGGEHVVVPPDQMPPGLVPDDLCQVRGLDDVGEHEHPLHPRPRGRLGVPGGPRRAADVDLRTQSLERRAGRVELEDRLPLVPLRTQRLAEPIRDWAHS